VIKGLTIPPHSIVAGPPHRYDLLHFLVF